MTQSANRVLREERGEALKRLTQLADAGIRSPKDRDEFDKLELRIQMLSKEIERVESGGAAMYGFRGGAIGTGLSSGCDEVRSAFGAYLRRGRGELTPAERALLRWDSAETRDMGTGGGNALAGTGGGYFVPVGFVRDVEQALKYYGPMLDGGPGMPTIMDTDTGQPLPYPTSNDTAVEGEMVAENDPTTSADVSLGNVVFGAFKFSSKLVKCSLELIQDSAFDLEAFLKQQFAMRLGRILNRKLTLGVGGGTEPLGIVPAAVAGGLTVTATGANTNDGASAANSIGSDDLTNLEHAVDPLYRPGAMYMMNDTTLRAIKRVKDKYGRPLWQPAVSVHEPDTINGYRYCINPFMDELQTHASSPYVTRKTVLFGALSKYTVRQVKQMSVLRLSERFAEYGQVAFISWYRGDGQLLDAGTHPIAVLENVY